MPLTDVPAPVLLKLPPARHTLATQFDLMDLMAGCTRGHVISVEAMWDDRFILSWREAFDVTAERYGQGTPEQIAALEAMLAVQSLATYRPAVGV